MTTCICPKCGSENIASLITLEKNSTKPLKNSKDDLTAHASEETNPSLSPIYHCNSCKKTFGGDHTAFLKTTTQIILNTHEKGEGSQNLTFSKTSTGATIEGPFLCYYPDLPEIYINQQQWSKLLSAFFALHVLDWANDYPSCDTSDAFSWDLKITFDDSKPFISKGQNNHPPYWQDLMQLFVSFGLPNISNKLGQNFLQLQT